MAALSPEHIEALRQIAAELGAVRWALGGSALLALSGIDVDVGDIDVMVDAVAEAQVSEALPDFAPADDFGQEPFHSAWLRRGVRAGVQVEIIGDMAVRHSHGVEVYRPVSVRAADLGGTDIPLASLEDWMRIYSVIAPSKAAQIAAVLGLAPG